MICFAIEMRDVRLKAAFSCSWEADLPTYKLAFASYWIEEGTDAYFLEAMTGAGAGILAGMFYRQMTGAVS